MYPIDSSVALPATHYLMMGAQGNGSYNLQDVLSDINDPDKANLPHKNITKYCQRVKKMGIIGYSKFLINKFYWTIMMVLWAGVLKAARILLIKISDLILLTLEDYYAVFTGL